MRSRVGRIPAVAAGFAMLIAACSSAQSSDLATDSAEPSSAEGAGLSSAAVDGSESADDGAQSAPGASGDLPLGVTSGSSSLGFENSVRSGGVDSVEGGQFSPRSLAADEGSELVLFDSPSEPVFWGGLGLRIDRTSSLTIDGDPALKIEFEAQNAVDQARQYQIGLFNVVQTGAASPFPIIGLVDHLGSSGSALLFPESGGMGVELFVATPELITVPDGLRMLVGTAVEIGIEIPLDGQPNRLPDYPVQLDVAGLSPPDLTATNFSAVAACESDFVVEVRDVRVDVVYPARFTVVPAGVRTLTVLLNFEPRVGLDRPCPAVVKALKGFPLTIETDIGPGELVLADAIDRGLSDTVGSVGFIGIYEIQHQSTEIAIGFDELGYTSPPQGVELGHLLNEVPTFGSLDPTGAGGEWDGGGEGA